MSKPQANRLVYYDFTLHLGEERDEPNFIKIRTALSLKLVTICSNFVYQLEMGDETKKYHYQGRFKLKERERLTAVKKMFGDDFPSIHLSVTSTEVAKKDDWSYVEKEATRIDGPWSRETLKRDVERETALKEEQDRLINRMPYSLKNIELRSFQKQCLELLKIYNKRYIDILYNRHGNVGKTLLSKYLEHFRISMYIPGGLGDHLIPFACSWLDQNKHLPEPRAFHFDLPRAFFNKSKEKVALFWEQVESLKDGILYDWRQYTRKINLIYEPNILIFTNKLPDFTFLSLDRIRVWTVNEDLILEPYRHEPLPLENYHLQMEVMVQINQVLGISHTPVLDDMIKHVTPVSISSEEKEKFLSSK